MKDSTFKVVTGFMEKRAVKIKNFETDGKSVWLHGNKIALRDVDFIYLTAAHWNTVLTREKLNALMEAIGCTYLKFTSVKDKLHFNDEPVDPYKILKLQMSSPFLYEFVPSWPDETCNNHRNFG